MTPETILTDARVLTMDPARPRAEALALAAGRIVAVGGRGEVERLAGPQTEVISCGGASVLPGFVESHLHLILGGVELGHLQLGHGHRHIQSASDCRQTHHGAQSHRVHRRAVAGREPEVRVGARDRARRRQLRGLRAASRHPRRGIGYY